MALNISINLCPTEGDMAKQLEQHLSALGFRRSAFSPGVAERLVAEAAPKVETPIGTKGSIDLTTREFTPTPTPTPQEFVNAGIDTIIAGEVAADEETSVLVQREPGKPKPGCKRRTHAEIAEDEAYFAAQNGDAAPFAQGCNASAESGETAQPSPSATEAAEQSGSAASASPIDPAVQAQDRADEARETAATKTGLTHDDVRHAAGAYAKVHGLPAAIKNVPVILGCAIIEVPDTQEALADAVRKLTIATEAPTVTAAPVVAAHIEENKPVTATKKDVVDALLAYALKYDGQNADMKTAVHTQSDGKAIVKQVTGADHLGVVKDDPETWGRLLVAVNDALANNPFGRAVLK